MEVSRRFLLALLWIQLAVILFTIPAGRVAFDLLGLRISFGGNAYKLCTAFLMTWAVLWLVSGRPRIRAGVFLPPLAGLAFVIILSGTASGYLYQGLKAGLKVALCAGFYCALVNLPMSKKGTRSVMGAFVIGNLYLSLVVLFELIVGGQFRAEGTFGHPNLLAAYALLGLPMLLLIARLCREWRTHLFVFGVALLLFLSILLTFSRGAYLGLLVSVFLIWKLGQRRALIHLIPLLGVAVIAAPFLAGPALSRLKGETLLDVSARRPQSRLVIWTQSFRYTVPGLPAWGWGIGDPVKDRLFYLQSLRADRSPYPPINHAHNLLLHVWLALGLPGLLMILWLAVRFVRFVPPRAPGGTWGRYGEHAYFFGSIVGFAVFACFDTLLFSKNVTPALALFLGMLERLKGYPDQVTHPVRMAERVEPPLVSVRPLRALRILHLFGNYRYTGPAGMVLTVCSLLLERGHKVVFACPPGRPRWRISSHGLVITRPEEQDRRAVRPLAIEHKLPIDENLRLNRHLNFFDNLSDIRYLRNAVRRGEWDVIHAHFPHELSLAALALGSSADRPVLVASSYKDRSPPTNPLSRYVFRRVSALLCVSTSTRDGMVRDGLIDDASCHVLPGMVDPQRFHPGLDGGSIRERLGIPPGAPVAGMISRFQPYRRHDLVVEAWVDVVRQIPDARLVLIGRGENEARIRELVERKSLSDSVIFAGYRTDDFPQHVAALDLLIYLRPGSDGSCRTVLEAMAVGRPCLVAPVGALLDLVQDDVTGVVVREERPEALAAAIVNLLSSPRKMLGMGPRGRQLVERRHTPAHVVDLFEEVYSSAIASKGTPEHEV